MRALLVKSVATGRIREAPISAAFSTMKSVRAFLIGAKRSHRSGGSRWGALWRRQRSVPPRLPASATSAVHSPAKPLNSATRSPGTSRITENR